MDRRVTFKQEETSGHEPQSGLDTKTDRLTDRQLQSDFDFDTRPVAATCSLYSRRESPTQKMEAIRSSETSVLTKTTRRQIPDDGFLQSHRRENLKSYKKSF
jgi:hypothetical protein